MGLIAEEIIQQVLDRNDIVSTISSYIPLKRAGRNFKGLCPFHHEKTPSFVVNPDKQIYHCFGCNAGGNVIGFVMQQERMEFPEAVEMLAQKAGITIVRQNDGEHKAKASLKQLLFKVNDLAATFFHDNLMSAQNAQARPVREYLKNRNITPDLAKKFKIGFAPDEWDTLLNFLNKKDVPLGLMEKAGLIIVKENRQGYYDRFRNRVTFPIFDHRSQAIGFGARTLEKDLSAKYVNSPETPVYTKGNHLYGFHAAKEAVGREDFAIVVEGYMDFLIPYQAGVENIVASLGTALTVEQIRLLRRYTENVVMLFDADQAGEAAMIRSLDSLIEEGMNVKVAKLTKGDDPDSFVVKQGVEAFREKIREAKTLFDYKLGWLNEKFDIKSVEGASRVAQEMLPTLNKFNNEVMKFGYLKRLSEALKVSMEALTAQMKKSESAFTIKNKSGFIEQPVRKSPSRAVEINILRLLLEEEELIPLTRGELMPDDFEDENIRSVINRIFDFSEQGKAVDLPSLINSFADEKIQAMLSGLMTDEVPLSADKKKMHRDYINRIKNDRLRSARQDLGAAIRVAEAAGDVHQLNELKEKFNRSIQLIKGS